MTPYATPADRARALYRLPTAPRRNRTLEICQAHPPLLAGGRWPGEGHVSCVVDAAPTAALPVAAGSTLASLRPGAQLPFGPQSFDLVILHQTLDDLAAASADFDAQAFLDQVAEVLVPGGLVAGCVRRRDSLPARLRRLSRRLRLAGPAADEPRFSLAGLRQALETAHFSGIRTFALLPSCDAPLKIVDTDPEVSRVAFRREVDARRRHLHGLAFLLRQIAAEIGLFSQLESSIFFWAYKPC